MAKKTTAPEFDLDVVDTAKAADILKASRQRGSRSSKYTPIYESVAGLGDGEFVVLRSITKSAKLGIYQGVKRTFGTDVKMASARERDAADESYTIVIGRATDYEQMRDLAKRG